MRLGLHVCRLLLRLLLRLVSRLNLLLRHLSCWLSLRLRLLLRRILPLLWRLLALGLLISRFRLALRLRCWNWLLKRLLLRQWTGDGRLGGYRRLRGLRLCLGRLRFHRRLGHGLFSLRLRRIVRNRFYRLGDLRFRIRLWSRRWLLNRPLLWFHWDLVLF